MNAELQRQWRRRGSSQDHFPTKIYAMLELSASGRLGGASDAVAWRPHGRAFKIIDEDVLMDAVAPLFFRLTKFRSLQRQLHLWGFKRISKGIDEGAYYNEHFLRGRPEDMQKIVRRKIKGKSAKAKSSLEREEPDFYAMPPLPIPGAAKPEMMGGVLENPAIGPNSTVRRVSMESILFDQRVFNRSETATNLGQLVPPQPELTFTRRDSYPSPVTISPMPLNVDMPSTISLNQDGPLVDHSRVFNCSEFNGGEAGADLGPLVSPQPDCEAKRSLAVAAAGTKPLPSLLSSFGGNSLPWSTPNIGKLEPGMYLCAPCAIGPNRDGPQANTSPASSDPGNQNLSQRNNSSTFAASCKAESKLAASSETVNRNLRQKNTSPTFPANHSESKLGPGMKSFPFGMSAAIAPSEDEETKWPKAGLEPLPFDGTPAASEAKRGSAAAAAGTRPFRADVSVVSFLTASESEEMGSLAADLEPLPFDDGLPVDEFSDYIDEKIQIL